MEPTQQSQEAIEAQAQKLKEAQDLKIEVNVDKPGAIVKPPASSPLASQPWQEWVQGANEFVSKLPAYFGDFFSSYQKLLIALGVIVGAGVTVKVTLAILDAIDDIPLLAPLFEVIGIGYTVWFVNRYLLKVETRKELGNEFKALKAQVIDQDQV